MFNESAYDRGMMKFLKSSCCLWFWGVTKGFPVASASQLKSCSNLYWHTPLPSWQPVWSPHSGSVCPTRSRLSNSGASLNAKRQKERFQVLDGSLRPLTADANNLPSSPSSQTVQTESPSMHFNTFYVWIRAFKSYLTWSVSIEALERNGGETIHNERRRIL